jgi:hypothetical protein
MQLTEPAPGLALSVLRAATIKGTTLVLNSGQLDRALYEEVNEVLVRLGGAWKRGAGGHVFPFDPAPLLRVVLETGRMPERNPLAFFPTPGDLAAEMAEDAVRKRYLVDPACRILEPHGGHGALALAARRVAPEAHLDVVELDPLNAEVLRRAGLPVHERDFLTFEPDAGYDVILMNPPFRVQQDQHAYITHTLHAWGMLRDRGELVGIAPQSFIWRTDRRSREFRLLVATYGGWTRLPRGTFAGAGTNVETVLLWMEKEDQSWRRQPHCGWPSWHTWALELLISNESEFYPERQRLMRNLASGVLPLGPSGGAVYATDRAIRDYYTRGQEWALQGGTGVDLTEEDFAVLVHHLISEFRSEYGDRARADAPVGEPDAGAVDEDMFAETEVDVSPPPTPDYSARRSVQLALF